MPVERDYRSSSLTMGPRQPRQCLQVPCQGIRCGFSRGYHAGLGKLPAAPECTEANGDSPSVGKFWSFDIVSGGDCRRYNSI